MSAVEGLLPFPLRWRTAPAEPPAIGPSSLEIAAGPRTDLFADPAGADPVLNAPLALGRFAGDFQLAASMTSTFEATFDAAALIVWAGPRAWAKLALERSPDDGPTVVSVVTRGVSDDCNSTAVPSGRTSLRVARIGAAVAFHASADGHRWSLVRFFTFAGAATAAVGFLAQSPLGDGTRASFDDVSWSADTLRDIRSGE